jgi:hypothetical protein
MGTWALGSVIFYYLDIALKGNNAGNARQIVTALGEIRDGKGFSVVAEEARYTDIEDRAVNAWKFEYLDFKDRDAALEALRLDLDRIDPDWRDCLIVD